MKNPIVALMITFTGALITLTVLAASLAAHV